MYKEIFMKRQNVSYLLNGDSCYGHSREELESVHNEVYSVMVHSDYVTQYKNVPFTHRVEKNAKFHSLKSVTNVDKK